MSGQIRAYLIVGLLTVAALLTALGGAKTLDRQTWCLAGAGACATLATGLTKAPRDAAKDDKADPL